MLTIEIHVDEYEKNKPSTSPSNNFTDGDSMVKTHKKTTFLKHIRILIVELWNKIIDQNSQSNGL
jgi:hypothetical protein